MSFSEEIARWATVTYDNGISYHLEIRTNPIKHIQRGEFNSTGINYDWYIDMQEIQKIAPTMSWRQFVSEVESEYEELLSDGSNDLK